jgi:hypothetical protein
MPQVVQVKQPLPATEQKTVESTPASLPDTDSSDGRVTGQEAYFAAAALNRLIVLHGRSSPPERVYWVMLKLAAGLNTSAGIHLSPQETLLLKDEMKSSFAYFRQQTRDNCAPLLLRSAMYLYRELQQAQDKGLYASMYTRKFSPAKAKEEAQAWLRNRGYLKPKENLKALTGGQILHFAAPAKGKPMLILYPDQVNKIKDVQEGIYKDFLKWHGRGVRHILMEGMPPRVVFRWYADEKELFCGGMDLTCLPMKLYCVVDEIVTYGVEDAQIYRQGSGCDILFPQLADKNRRNQALADNIEKAPWFPHHDIALMNIGAASAQYLIDELPKRGMGLMLIEMPQIREHLEKIEMLPRFQDNYLPCHKLDKRCKRQKEELELLIQHLKMQRLGHDLDWLH